MLELLTFDEEIKHIQKSNAMFAQCSIRHLEETVRLNEFNLKEVAGLA